MTTWRIYNTIDGTDLGEYEASSRADALRMFLADTDDVTLAPGVMAEQVQGNRTGTGAVSASNQLDPVLLDYITGAYQGWARAREYSPKAPEPSIGIGELVGYVEQHNVVDTLRKANLYPSDSKYFRKYVRSAVETSVQRLLRQGLLVRSLGLVRSARGTTVHEAHVFEPARNGR
jgi:hypothetical protein